LSGPTSIFDAQLINGLSVNIEDWFRIGVRDQCIDDGRLGTLSDRLERNCDQFLQMFGDHDVKATFFVLGSVARQHPFLLRRISNEGHELASHGWDHSRVYRMEREEFARDLELSRKAIEDAVGLPVTGYRAPSFSIDRRTPWAYMILAEQGFTYSSSVAPVAHEHYGWSEAPRFTFRPLPWSELLEIPVATAMFAGRRLQADSGYFRVMRYGLPRWAIRQVNRREGRPAVFYLNPWEVDPEAPHPANAGSEMGMRSPGNPDVTVEKLRHLIREFEWGRMDVLARREASKAVTLVA